MCHWRGHGLPLQPYRPRIRSPRNCIGLLSLGYDIQHYYLIKFLYPIIAPQNSSFSLLSEEKNGVLILCDWLHTHLCFSHVKTSLRMPCSHSWCFGVHNVSLNAPCSALSPTSYSEMEILWQIFFLEIWREVTPSQLCLLLRRLGDSFLPLSKSSNFQEAPKVTLAIIFVSSLILRFSSPQLVSSAFYFLFLSSQKFLSLHLSLLRWVSFLI